MTVPAGRIERWTYVGRRVADGDVVYAWLDADRRLWRFGQGRSLAIGARYEVAVVRDQTGRPRLGPETVFVEPPAADEPLLTEWTAHDRVAAGLAQLLRSEQRAKKSATTRYGSTTLQQLRDLHADLPARARAVLLAQVVLFLTEP